MRKIVGALCATQPIRGLVVGIGGKPAGRRFLTKLNLRGGVYESLDEAWKVAKRLRPHGHEHPETVERSAALAGVVLPSDYAVLYWLNRISGDIKLFDFGGSVGNVYYSYTRYVDTSKRCLQWTVFDLPPIIELAKRLAAKADAAKPRFTTTLQDAADTNVLLVSGVFHYWEKDTQSFLGQFPKSPEHVFINRSPFVEDKEPFISIQATFKYAYPIIVRRSAELINGFKAKDYELVDRWKAPEYGHDMPFFPDQSVKSYSGFYFRLKSA